MKLLLQKIEIEPEGCHLILDAHLDGEHLKLVLDSGASRTVVDYSFLEKIKSGHDFELQDDLSVGVGSNQLSSFLIEVAELQLGELKISPYTMASMDLSHVHQTYIQLGIDDVYGVLGSDILDRFDALINYRELSLELKVG